jgi:hypothetical protein
MAQLGIKEEEKILVLKYISGLSSYIQQENEFLSIYTLAKYVHYNIKLEEKFKGK